MKYLLYIATPVSLITYLFWEQLPKGSFYIGNALFIFLLCSYIFVNHKQSFIKFVLFGLSLNNLIDELFFNPTELGYNELALAVSLPIIWFYKTKHNAREICKQ